MFTEAGESSSSPKVGSGTSSTVTPLQLWEIIIISREYVGVTVLAVVAAFLWYLITAMKQAYFQIVIRHDSPRTSSR